MAKKMADAITADMEIPQTRDQADSLIRMIGVAQRERVRIETELNESVARITETAHELAEVHTTMISKAQRALLVWATANRKALTLDGGKTVALPAGEISWRSRPAKVGIKGTKAVIASLVKMKLTRFLREKLTVDKQAMLKEAALAVTVPGVKIGSAGEVFTVKPVETGLEEVTNGLKA